MAALGVFGFLGLVTGIIWLVISLIKRSQKRVPFIILGVAMAMIIVASIGSSGSSTSTQVVKTPNNQGQPTPSTPRTSIPTSTPAIAQVNQDVRVGKARFVVLSALDRGATLKRSESRYPTIAQDKTTSGRFIEVRVEIENMGEITESFVSSPHIIDSQNREYKKAEGVSEWIPTDAEWFLPALQPGVPKRFILIYEVAKDATLLKLKASDISFGSSKSALINLGL